VFTGEAKLRCKETFEEFKKLHNDIRNLLKEKVCQHRAAKRCRPQTSAQNQENTFGKDK
jgi:hypothetical protein